MITLLYISAAFLLPGVAFLLWELSRAPEGFQTEDGFSIAWKNNSPDAEDVCCVWAPPLAKQRH